MVQSQLRGSAMKPRLIGIIRSAHYWWLCLHYQTEFLRLRCWCRLMVVIDLDSSATAAVDSRELQVSCLHAPWWQRGEEMVKSKMIK